MMGMQHSAYPLFRRVKRQASKIKDRKAHVPLAAFDLTYLDLKASHQLTTMEQYHNLLKSQEDFNFNLS